MPKAKSYGKGNKYPKVVTSPSKANRSLNANVNVSTSPSSANKSLNAPAKVKPATYGKGY